MKVFFTGDDAAVHISVRLLIGEHRLKNRFSLAPLKR